MSEQVKLTDEEEYKAKKAKAEEERKKRNAEVAARYRLTKKKK